MKHERVKQTELGLGDAKVRRRRAARTSEHHVPGDLWNDFLLYLRSHETLTLEEWEDDLPSYLLIPLHRSPNMSGWVARQAQKRKLIEKSGTMETSAKKSRRRAMIHRWSSLLYKPPGRTGGVVSVE